MAPRCKWCQASKHVLRRGRQRELGVAQRHTHKRLRRTWLNAGRLQVCLHISTSAPPFLHKHFGDLLLQLARYALHKLLDFGVLLCQLILIGHRVQWGHHVLDGLHHLRLRCYCRGCLGVLTEVARGLRCEAKEWWWW